MGRAIKVREGDRLVWYDEAPTPDYWLAHWRARTPELLAAAREADPEADELGRLFVPLLAPGASLLEAGCGAGWWVAALAEHGFRAEGIDFSPELVDLVRATDPAVEVRVGDALAIDRPDGTYDAYLSIGVIEHRREGPEPFLAEAHRVLVPGGLAIVAVPAYGPLRRLRARLRTYDRAPAAAAFHQYGFSRRELVALMAAAGFEVERATHYAGHRLWCEELPGYRWLTLQRGGRHVQRLVDAVLRGRDGHMVVALGRRG